MIQEKRIEEALKELFANLKFTAEPAGLYDPLRYMMEIGGKRIRPRLCLTTYALYKDDFCKEIDVLLEKKEKELAEREAKLNSFLADMGW